MSKDFDFNRVGKRLPYTAPEGFLNNMEEQVLERIKDEMKPFAFVPMFLQETTVEQVKGKEKPSKPKRNNSLVYSIFGGLVAASVALLLVFNMQGNHQKADDFEVLEQAFSNLSSADQNYLLTVYQDDLFMNE